MPQDKDQSKLVTVAIHTYEKAQILQSLLQSQGIPATLHNVNTVQPVFSTGVRVRIAERDLPRALAYIEDLKWDLDEAYDVLQEKSDLASESPDTAHVAAYKGYVLIPVDFSVYTDKIVKLGFHFAARRQLHVLLMHVYTGTLPQMNFPYGDFTALLPQIQAASNQEAKRAEQQMNDLTKEIDAKMAEGTLPEVTYRTTIRDGIPADEILRYAKRNLPAIIIMGTRGKTEDSDYIVGSVAAEIIDRAQAPVLVVPEKVVIDDLMQVKHVGVATSFNQRDLVLFNQMMLLMAPLEPEYRLFNVSRSEGKWGDVQLQAIQEYNKQQYPNAHIEWTKLNEGELYAALEDFVAEHQVELIVVNTYKRRVLAKLFNPTMARRMLFHAGTPILVMHSNSSSQ